MAKSKSLIGVIGTILIVMLLLLLLGFLMTFINNGQRSFYVQHGNLEVSNNVDGVELKRGAYSVFYTKYILPTENTDYSVFVTSNKKLKNDFDFRVDGGTYSFKAQNDFSDAFNLVKGKDCFALYVESQESMQTILAEVFTGKAVTDVSDMDLSAVDYFTIYVTASNGEEITINFRIKAVNSDV